LAVSHIYAGSSNTILVDGAEVGNGDTAVIKDGSEIIPGPDREG
jgi:hypothetical protein